MTDRKRSSSPPPRFTRGQQTKAAALIAEGLTIATISGLPEVPVMQPRLSPSTARYDAYGYLVDSVSGLSIPAPPQTGRELFKWRLTEYSDALYDAMSPSLKEAYDRDSGASWARYRQCVAKADNVKFAEERKAEAGRAALAARKAAVEKAKRDSGRSDADRAADYKAVKTAWLLGLYTGPPEGFLAWTKQDDARAEKQKAAAEADPLSCCKCVKEWCTACHAELHVAPHYMENHECPAAHLHPRQGSFCRICERFRCDGHVDHTTGAFISDECWCTCSEM